MQSVPILHRNLTQIHALLWLIYSREIDSEEIIAGPFVHVLAASPDMSAAVLAEPFVCCVMASVVAKFRRRIWRQQFEVGWAIEAAVCYAELLAEGAVAA